MDLCIKAWLKRMRLRKTSYIGLKQRCKNKNLRFKRRRDSMKRERVGRSETTWGVWLRSRVISISSAIRRPHGGKKKTGKILHVWFLLSCCDGFKDVAWLTVASHFWQSVRRELPRTLVRLLSFVLQIKILKVWAYIKGSEDRQKAEDKWTEILWSVRI